MYIYVRKERGNTHIIIRVTAHVLKIQVQSFPRCGRQRLHVVPHVPPQPLPFIMELDELADVVAMLLKILVEGHKVCRGNVHNTLDLLSSLLCLFHLLFVLSSY